MHFSPRVKVAKSRRTIVIDKYHATVKEGGEEEEEEEFSSSNNTHGCLIGGHDNFVHRGG